MPKLKTNRGAAKRFSRTGGGGFRRSHSNVRHILTKKSPKRKRQLRGTAMIAKADLRMVNRMLPHT